MSIDRCSECNAPVDTDFDGDCYQPDPRHSLKGFPDICLCKRCRESDEYQIDDCPDCGNSVDGQGYTNSDNGCCFYCRAD